MPQLILNSLLSFDNSPTHVELFLFGSVCECGLRNTVVRLCDFVKCGVLTLVREIPHNRNYCCCQWGYVMYVWFWNSLPLTHNYFIIISMVSALTWPDPVSAVLTGKHESGNINKLRRSVFSCRLKRGDSENIFNIIGLLVWFLCNWFCRTRRCVCSTCGRCAATKKN